MSGELIILAVAYVMVWLLVWSLTRQNERLLKLNEQLICNNRKLLDMLAHLDQTQKFNTFKDWDAPGMEAYDEYNHSDCAL
jgi:hypothetical protein